MIAARWLRDRRRSFLGWCLGLLALVLFTVSLYPSIRGQASFDEVVANLPEALRSIAGYQEGIPLTSPEGYLQGRLFASLAPLLVLVFAIGAGAQAIAGAEENGTLEQLLANPVTRTRVFWERYAAYFGLVLSFVAVFIGLLVVLAVPFDALDGVPLGNVVGAGAGMFGLALLHGTLAYAVGAATGRRLVAIAVATGIAVAGYLIQSILGLTDVLQPIRHLVPWHWYLERNMLAEGFAPVSLLAPLVVAAVLSVAAWAAFVRRDLH